MIDEIIILKILAVILLVLINGFFVAAEFALVKIRETQLNPLIAQGNRSAKLAKSIVGNLDKYLSAAQLGITLASLALGWVGEPVFKDLLAVEIFQGVRRLAALYLICRRFFHHHISAHCRR